MGGTSLFLWIIYPYLVLAVFLFGVVARFNGNPYGWTSKSSELLEKRLLRAGSTSFHWGIIFVFFGHVGGLLVPIEVYHALGVPDEAYHVVALGAGTIAGIAALFGVVMLIYRRWTVKRVRMTSSAGDWIALLFLLVVIATGMMATGRNALAESAFDYRTTINPWIRGVLIFRPDPSLMADVPAYFKVHVAAAFGLFAVFPFTRLVHVFSLPVTYLWRSYVLYRRRGSGKSA
ncbi:nitrate reductase [Gordoniibacillus kamchatkensis]|uniref:Nitrate reductase n=1 Tax=Gordoniibacillus kamchatkensis TaxID=1590651 RepID=A0ABR5AKU9_9BACL|nr:respiratory nitrate reductase subunit gamma [Paenibacillus sp. VKM B-2647]KIL41669.1 nitrate reductase [Paenibacillus sp. VKM B-2647]